MPQSKPFLPAQEPAALFVPGWNGSAPSHWQRIWNQRLQRSLLVEQAEWRWPQLPTWLEQLDEAVNVMSGPVLLVGHSLGSTLIAHWSSISRHAARIQGALLVAPPWLGDAPSIPAELRSFAPTPTGKLKFPSWLVASENDPYLPQPLARCLAAAWGSSFVNAGMAGHLNVESGHGEWPEGQRLLRNAMHATTGRSQASVVTESLFD